MDIVGKKPEGFRVPAPEEREDLAVGAKPTVTPIGQ